MAHVKVVLDASAVIGWLTAEPAAVEVERLIAAGGACCSSLNLGEVVDHLVRIRGVAAPDVAAALGLAVQGGLTIVSVDRTLGARAGVLRATHYSRSTQPVSLADCIALATAENLGATLVTGDAGLVAMAVSAGVDVHPIPSSSGLRPALSP